MAVPERVVVTVPGAGGCGDYATNIALQLARPSGQPPRRVAEILRPHLVEVAGVADVVVTGPGFINISLRDAADGVAALVEEILRAGLRYGHSDALAGQVTELRIPYEVRAEVVADAIERIVAAQGGRVEVDHGEPVNLRPVPAPEDPAPLGPDAARWALLHPAAHDRPRITADHLVQRASNPLFRVRYASARTRALTRNAAALGFTADPGAMSAVLGLDAGVPVPGSAPTPADGAPLPLIPGAMPAGPGLDAAAPGTGTGPTASGTPLPVTSLLTAPPPGATPLLTTLAAHPSTLTRAATLRAPDRLARHLVAVADATLVFLPSVLPFGDEKPSAAHRARLALAEAAGAVLAGGLSLLGIDAPDHL